MKYEDLKILDELREKGSISEEEYQREKEKIFNEPRSSFSKTTKKPLFGFEENTYLMLMHLTQQKDSNSNVDTHGKNILNAMISYAIYAVVLCVTVIGIPVAVVLGLLFAIFIVIASVKANNGEYWKYPFTIQFIK